MYYPFNCYGNCDLEVLAISFVSLFQYFSDESLTLPSFLSGINTRISKLSHAWVKHVPCELHNSKEN